MESEETAVRDAFTLQRFDKSGLQRGRPKLFEALWWVARVLIVQSSWPWPSSVRAATLRRFGAKVGRNVNLRPGLAVHFPWKLVIGDNAWVGDRCTILNLEPVTIENDAALAHEVYVSTGNHDIYSPTFGYANSPVIIRQAAWIGSRSFISAGVTVGRGAVVAAGSCVIQDVSEWTVVGGVPAKKIADRYLSGQQR